MQCSFKDYINTTSTQKYLYFKVSSYTRYFSLYCGMMSNIYWIYFIFIFYLSTNCGLAQVALTHNPYVINFSKFDYQGGTENWKIISSRDGFIFAANNEGLLIYNGKSWQKYTLPNQTIVRSLVLDTLQNRLYAGGQDEFGYFYKTDKGFWNFKTLKPLMPKGFEAFEDVWDLQIGNGHIYFRTLQQVFAYNGKSITKINTKGYSINFIKWVQDRLYLGDSGKGVLQFSGQQLIHLPGSEIFKGHRISDIIHTDGILLFLSEKNGIYKWNGDIFSPFITDSNIKNLILTNILRLENGQFAVASVLGGVLFSDKKGQILYTITKKQGLQNNNIISMSLDEDGNLWLGTTHGIDQVLINSPYQIMYPDGDLQGSVFDVKYFDHHLYVATNSGVFYTPWNPGSTSVRNTGFHKVRHTEGQAWSLEEVYGELFLCHNEGLFRIQNDAATKISPHYGGVWKCIPLDDGKSFLAGTYNGFQLYALENGSYVFQKEIPGFTESARIVSRDNQGSIWVSHPYRGVYKLDYLAAEKKWSKITTYGKKDGLPSDLANYITPYRETMLINGETGIYQYSGDKNTFVLNQELTEIFGKTTRTRRLFYDGADKFWFITEGNSGMIVMKDWVTKKSFTKYLTPFLDGKYVGGFENIYSPFPRETFICTNRGVILMNLAKFYKKDPIQLRFNDINIIHDDTITSVVSGISSLPETLLEFDFENHTLQFTFGSNHLDPTTPIQYATYLDGLNDDWSAYTYQSEKTFYALRPGKYTLRVKAKSGDGRESSVLTFSFSIKNPWYRTTTAIVSYFLLLCALIWVLILFLEKKHEGEKIQLKQDFEKSEAKVELLLDEKLQTELDFKNKELALSTMHILQKNEVLTKIREELDHLMSGTTETNTRSNIKKIISLLSDDQRLEDDWESFAFYFDQVHTDFLRRLKEKYPQLSNRDLRLCAYLRMNLTTKDIAPLLNISVRGVEISRYRLRKKMDIDTDINLNEFMMNY